MERLAKIESNYFPFLPFPEEENRRYLMIRNIFIEEPSLPVYETLRKYDVSISEIIKYYRLMQVDENLQLITNSIFYPRRIMFQVGRRMVTDFNSDREYIERLLSGKPVSSRIVEIHATKGTCNYNCVMCLWSDKNKHTYRTKNMEGSGLMSLDDWKKILTEIKNLGARTVVFSGGGEPLLNRDFFPLIEFAHNIGFATQLYTNGFYLRGLTEYEWDQILAMERIRFSIHSPFEKQYSQIIGVPSSIGALTRVRENLQDLIMKRNNKKSKTAIGIGFVIQAINFNQIIEMADFAKQAEVDFLDLRSDEVKISGSLNAEQQKEVYRQLNIVRRRIIFGVYNPLIVDLSDNLTAFANGEKTII